jgi:hypothetical protein
MKTSLLASAASPFAHLLGRASASAATQNEADRLATEAEAARRAANVAAGRAEEDDGEDEDEKKKKEEEEKAKKAKNKKAKGDAESDDDDEGDEDMKAVRARERGRCAAIFADAAAGKRPDAAAQIAFGTSLNRDEAITLLRAVAGGESAAAAATPRQGRMAAVPSPELGAPGNASDGAPDPGAAFAARAIELARSTGDKRV